MGKTNKLTQKPQKAIAFQLVKLLFDNLLPISYNYIVTIDELKTLCREKNYPIIKDETAEYLCNFVKTAKPKEILEIGLCAGYSASLFLSACNTKLTSIEIDEERFLQAKENLIAMEFTSDRYNLILGDACELLPKFSKKFDFIFLDGPKGQYINLLPYILDLLKCGDTFIADNVGYFGKVAANDYSHKHRTAVKNLQTFIDRLRENKNLEVTFPNVGDGLAVCKLIQNSQFTMLNK